jgi:hypothetical protein
MSNIKLKEKATSYSGYGEIPELDYKKMYTRVDILNAFVAEGEFVLKEICIKIMTLRNLKMYIINNYTY